MQIKLGLFKNTTKKGKKVYYSGSSEDGKYECRIFQNEAYDSTAEKPGPQLKLYITINGAEDGTGDIPF